MVESNLIFSKYILPSNSGAIFGLRKNPEEVKELVSFKLISKTQITHDTFIFTFELPENNYLGINLGHHVIIEAVIPLDVYPLEEKVSRKYTPISLTTQLNAFDLLIKIYNKTEVFPGGGKLTGWLDKIPIGSEVNMRGPRGRILYYGEGDFLLASKKVKPITWRRKQFKKVGMLCGGTGITPIYQILKAADLNKDSIEYYVLFGNRTSKDILLKNELDKIYTEQNIKLKLNYTIDNDEEGWNDYIGFITKDKIEKCIPPPSDDTLIMTCGSGKMCKKYLVPLLIEMGYKEENIHNF